MSATGSTARRGASRPRDMLASPRTAVAVMIALVLATPALYVLWWTAPVSTVPQARFDPSLSPFPVFPAGPILHVVSVPPDVNESTRLTLLSLQGIVNRAGVEIYLDFGNESADPSSILSFLRTRYSVATDAVSIDWLLDHYLGRADGLVVYDPRRPESVNIATTYAGIHDAVIAGPDTATNLAARSGRPVLLDYGSSNWTSFDAIGAYDRAMRELYPQSDHDLLAILPPDQDALRDYLVASRTFVFYEPQGVLATPLEIASTLRILHATPRGIPILGWFRSPTLTEENAFIQLASSEGKFVLGTEATPNLSALTAFGRNTAYTQGQSPLANLTLQDRIYAVVAVADGDNLDFVAHRMKEMWADPARGTFPVAWSLDPLVADLAPPYMEYFYGSASSVDRFVAGPSGAGYLYPDFAGPGDLPAYLQFSKRYMEQAAMEVPWILNAFTASEIPHSSASLRAYVDGLSPRGIALDYDDQPVTADYWMQAGSSGAAPVIRSTHLWTSQENFLAKAQAAQAARPSGPAFLWMTIYPWRFGLGDAEAALAELSARTGLAVDIVTPEQLFALLVQDFRARAHVDLASMAADPIAANLFPGYLSRARVHIAAADAAAVIGNPQTAAYEAYLASETLREAVLWEDLAVVGTGALGLVGIVAFLTRRRTVRMRPTRSEVWALLAGTGIVALFLFDFRAVLRDNFWTYTYVLVGIVVAGFATPLRSFLEKTHARRAGPVAFLLFALASFFTFWTSAGFPLAMLTGVLALQSVLRNCAQDPRRFLFSFMVGIAAGFLLPVDPIACGGLAAVLLACAVLTPPSVARSAGTSRPNRAAWPLAFAMVLPLIPLAAFHSFSVGLRLELQGADLIFLGVGLVALAPAFSLPLTVFVPPGTQRSFAVRAFLVAVLFSGGMLFARASVTTTLMLLGAASAFALAAWALLQHHVNQGGELERVAAPLLSLTPLVVLFLRLPPVAYSLAVGPLPWALEYTLYAPPVLWIVVALVFGGAVVLRRTRV